MDTFTVKLARNLAVDVLQVVDSRMGICANSGAGKSHALRLLVEQIAGRIPVHILDPEGEYVTLRSMIDAVVVSSDDGDGDIVPSPATAFQLAQRLREHQVSAILDLSELDRAGRLQFAAQYLRGLLASPRSSWRPTLVALDEAHRFAPEVVSRGGTRDEIAAAHECRAAVITLMDAGCKRQLGGILATQRLSKVAKDALNEANTLLIGRFAQDNDLRRVSNLLGLPREAWKEIQSFEPGEFFAQGPALSKPGTEKIRTLRTKTKPPREGGRYTPSRPSTSVRRLLGELSALAPAPEPVTTAAANDDPAAPAASSRKPAAADRARWIAQGAAAERTKWEVHVETLRQEVAALPKVPVRDLPDAIETLLPRFLQGPSDSAAAAAPSPPKASGKRPRTRGRPKVSAPAPSNGKLPFTWNTAPGRILTVLIQHHPEILTTRRIATLATVRHRSSTWRSAMARLRKLGLVDDHANGIAASARAVADHGADVPPLPAGEEFIGQWSERLGTGVPRKMFDALLGAPDGALDRDVLCTRVGIDPGSSTSRSGLARLRNAGLVDAPSGKQVCLASHVLQARQ